jgi:hypothetical protein
MYPTRQRNKALGTGYGHMAPRDAKTQPWYETVVDMIGPWEIKVNGEVYKFCALTIIDTVTNLTELIRMLSTKAREAANKLETTWLM